ncbi:MAG: hypothetical protein ACOYJZ_02280 [Acutalibacter sp.]
MMNLTDRVRQGNPQAMETLYDMTKQKVMALCSLLLQEEPLCQQAVPRVYRALWDQVLDGKLTTEEAFEEAALRKAAALCQTLAARKSTKAFRIPTNRNFVQGVGESKVPRRGELWEQVTASLPPLQRFLFVLSSLGGFSSGQLARMFRTNEETVRLALQAEPILLKRILATLWGEGEETSLTVEDLHKAWERCQVRAEVPQTVESSISNSMEALCRPIQQKRARKLRRMAAVGAAMVLVLCLGAWAVSSAVSGSGQEDAAVTTSQTEDSSAVTDSTETSSAAEETSELTSSPEEDAESDSTAADVAESSSGELDSTGSETVSTVG